MKETERIGRLVKALYNGHPWLEVNMMDNLSKLSWQKAGQKAHPKLNSIWEIVNHLISWRTNVLRRVQGEVIKTPANNYFAQVTDQSEQAWLRTLDNLQASQEAWIQFLEQAEDDILERTYPVNNMPFYEHMHGIIQHDAYHLGQIVLLAKMQAD
ncbi:MAG TPA: DinB family protein [Chitinophagaceae bacterium]|nr:DinB family protein [Chitinophagaceae bacterium]